MSRVETRKGRPVLLRAHGKKSWMRLYGCLSQSWLSPAMLNEPYHKPSFAALRSSWWPKEGWKLGSPELQSRSLPAAWRTHCPCASLEPGTIIPLPTFHLHKISLLELGFIIQDGKRTTCAPAVCATWGGAFTAAPSGGRCQNAVRKAPGQLLAEGCQDGLDQFCGFFSKAFENSLTSPGLDGRVAPLQLRWQWRKVADPKTSGSWGRIAHTVW